jgi:hypothetical protein
MAGAIRIAGPLIAGPSIGLCISGEQESSPDFSREIPEILRLVQSESIWKNFDGKLPVPETINPNKVLGQDPNRRTWKARPLDQNEKKVSF